MEDVGNADDLRGLDDRAAQKAETLRIVRIVT
jgi:hypothetical protein